MGGSGWEGPDGRVWWEGPDGRVWWEGPNGRVLMSGWEGLDGRVLMGGSWWEGLDGRVLMGGSWCPDEGLMGGSRCLDGRVLMNWRRDHYLKCPGWCVCYTDLWCQSIMKLKLVVCCQSSTFVWVAYQFLKYENWYSLIFIDIRWYLLIFVHIHYIWYLSCFMSSFFLRCFSEYWISLFSMVRSLAVQDDWKLLRSEDIIWYHVNANINTRFYFSEIYI